MKPYKIINATIDGSKDLEAFEDAVSAALKEGYEFASRLITKVVPSSNGTSKVLFFQPMVFEEMLEEIFEDTDEDEL